MASQLRKNIKDFRGQGKAKPLLQTCSETNQFLGKQFSTLKKPNGFTIVDVNGGVYRWSHLCSDNLTADQMTLRQTLSWKGKHYVSYWLATISIVRAV